MRCRRTKWKQTRRTSMSACYGFIKRSSSCSSCRLREARTRMCRRTVPVMRGEKPSGALWQREQFCSKTRWPSSGCTEPCDAVVCFPLLWGAVCVADVGCAFGCCAALENPQAAARITKPERRYLTLIVIYPSRLGIGTGRQFRSPRHCGRRWRKTAVRSW
jgi:hypothetical protein